MLSYSPPSQVHGYRNERMWCQTCTSASALTRSISAAVTSLTTTIFTLSITNTYLLSVICGFKSGCDSAWLLIAPLAPVDFVRDVHEPKHNNQCTSFSTLSICCDRRPPLFLGLSEGVRESDPWPLRQGWPITITPSKLLCRPNHPERVKISYLHLFAIHFARVDTDVRRERVCHDLGLLLTQGLVEFTSSIEHKAI